MAALAEVERKRAGLLDDSTADADEMAAKLALVESIDAWLADEVGIGGNKVGGGAMRGFDPVPLIEFAWERQLEGNTPDEIYTLFVEAQQEQVGPRSSNSTTGVNRG